MPTDLITLHSPVLHGISAGFGDELAGFVAGGTLAPEAFDTALRSTLAQDVLCFTFDSEAVAYVDETTGANDATTDDVELLNGTTLAIGDALYIGHATAQFANIQITIGVAGVHVDLAVAWEYWNGTAWTALSDVVDGTESVGGVPFSADAGTVAVTFTAPTDWEMNTVHSSTEGYWVRARVTTGDGVDTQCELTQIWVVTTEANRVWTDVTTDLEDAGNADVSPYQPSLHLTAEDVFALGHSTQKFCTVKFDNANGTAAANDITYAWEYWDGDSWETLTVDDQTVGAASAPFETTAANGLILAFEPPSDWTANTTANGPNGTAGYFIRLRVVTVTSATTNGTLDQAFVYTLNSASATGVRMPNTSDGTITRIDGITATVSVGGTDLKYLLVNVTTGAFASFTWTSTAETLSVAVSLAVAPDDRVMIVQVQEDATSQNGGGTSFYLTLVY